MQLLKKEESTKKNFDKSEKLLLSLVNNLPQVFWLTSTKDYEKVEYISSSFEDIWQIKPNEIYEDPRIWTKNIHEEDRQRVSKEFERFKEGKEEYFTEYRIVRKDGSIRWILDKAFWIKNDQGKIERLAGIAEDITERKKHDENIKESELRYRELYNNMSTCVAIYDAIDQGKDFVIKGINKSGEEKSKVKIKEIKGKRVSEVFPSVKEIGLFDVLKRVYATGKPEYLPTKVYKDDRISEWVENYVYKLPFGEIVAIYDDVSERKKAEEALKDSEDKFRSIFDSAQDAIFIINKEDRFIDANKKASKIFGYTKEEILNMSVSDFQAPEVKGIPGTLIKSELEKYKWNTFEALDIDKYGNKISVEISQSLFNLKGEEVVINIVRDVSRRKNMEDKLRESEHHYRGIFENSPIAIWEEDYSLIKKEIDKLKKSGIKNIKEYLDNNMDFVKKCVPLVKILNFNPSVLKLYGATNKREYLDNLTNIFSDSSFNVFKESMICIAEGKTHFYKEDKNHTIDGKDIDVLLTWSVVPGYEKNYEKVYVSTLDISVQKNAENQIKESEKRFRLLFDSVQAGVIVQSVNSKIVHANNNALESFGLLKKDMLDKTSTDPIWNMVLEDGTPVKGEDHPSMITIRTGKPLKDQIRGIYGDDPNKMRWLKINTRPIIDEKTNTFEEVLITFDDITDLKKYEKKLKESEEKYRRIVDTSNEGIWAIDENHVTTFVNPKMAEMLGYSPEEMLGQRFENFIFKEDLTELSNKMKLRREGLSEVYERRYIKKNGEGLYANVSATPMFDGHGNFKGSFVMITDITERKKNEMIIEELNDNLKLLNKILRHDISNDLTVVSIAIEMMATKEENIKNKAFSAINRSVNLIEKIRILESTMSTKYTLKKINIDQVLNVIKKTYPSVNVKISGECDVMADEAFISVIDNIINNSITHGKTDRIDIEINSDEDLCWMKISDYGKGIPDEIKDRIFDEEFSYGETRGTGLGLYIVKKTIERYGGSIKLEDTHPKGATFIITLNKSKL